MKAKNLRYRKNKDKVEVLLDDGNVVLRDNTNIIDKELYYENVIEELKERIKLTKRNYSDMEFKVVKSMFKMIFIITGSALIYNLTNISFMYFLLVLLISSIYVYKAYKNIDDKALLATIIKELEIKLKEQEEELDNVKKQEVVKVKTKNQEVYEINDKEITRVVNEPYYIAKNNYAKDKCKRRILVKRR